MQRYITPSSILSEARMMWEDYREIYILIEGESDKVFFNTLMGPTPNVRFRPVNGWERVHKTIQLAQEEAYSTILGVIDSDYHQLLGDGITENSQLLFTDSNDIEKMLFYSRAFEKFLIVCADENKLKGYQDPRKPILTAAAYVGALRAISLANQYNFNFDGFECKDFVNRNTLAANYRQLIEKITQRTRSNGTKVTVTNNDLEARVNTFLQDHNTHALCNGHDVLDVLSIAMTKLFASSSANQYNSDTLFDYLLLGYSVEEFQKSNLFQKLIGWINANAEVA